MKRKDVIAIRDFTPREYEQGVITKGTYGEILNRMRNNKFKVLFEDGSKILVVELGEDIELTPKGKKVFDHSEV